MMIAIGILTVLVTFAVVALIGRVFRNDGHSRGAPKWESGAGAMPSSPDSNWVRLH
jgi:hypothetical protein